MRPICHEDTPLDAEIKAARIERGMGGGTSKNADLLIHIQNMAGLWKVLEAHRDALVGAGADVDACIALCDQVGAG